MSKLKKSDWWKKSVVYQVYPKSFKDTNGDGIGDIPGIIEKLPYIKELGADVIWLNPIYKSPYVDNGYDISDYKEVHEDFGTMDDFDELLKKAHEMGLKIILDLVVNHTSSEHPWFKKSKESTLNQYRDYYIWKHAKNGELPTNWGSSFGGSTWEYVDAVGQYYLHLFAKEQPDLNWENPKVREEVYEIMRYWLNKGIDGFRMDVINLISKKPEYPNGEVINRKIYGSYYDGAANGPRVHEFLNEMNQKVLSHYDVMTVGETPHTNADEALLYCDADRKELDMVFHFDHMHLDYGPYGKFTDKKAKMSDLRDVLSHWQYKMADKGWNSLYWSNHDQARPVSRFGDDVNYRVESAKMLGTLLHMLKGTPYIFEGEEIGMTNVRFQSIADYDDIETHNIYKEFNEVHHLDHEFIMASIHAKSRDNARTPMQWDNSLNAGFSEGTPWLKLNPNYTEINVHNALGDKHSVFYYYKKLIALRKEYDVIVNGDYQLVCEDNPDAYSYIRKNDKETLLVICSFSTEEQPFNVPEDLAAKENSLLISNYDGNEDQELCKISLKPYEARVYLLK
ncbi:glycoside hydrolase family 13 protein [Sporolactobacillus laevolacticus]|uniref:glycoside hydrolase family 13 protein n=1 Tax=Sporolactobacillus laevolacticus TaxID=33018 RepID=UPI0025B55E59|nr:alpha-glucosidase [Sporolactobacillus laevolacticus]MDN3955604.1 alpha-glucosidase [Sporolactobacillus laevolacticus]